MDELPGAGFKNNKAINFLYFVDGFMPYFYIN